MKKHLVIINDEDSEVSRGILKICGQAKYRIEGNSYDKNLSRLILETDDKELFIKKYLKVQTMYNSFSIDNQGYCGYFNEKELRELIDKNQN